MPQQKLRYQRTQAGICVWLETADRDILVTKTLIVDDDEADALEQHIDRLNFLSYAYRRYKSALNNICLAEPSPRASAAMKDMAESVLKQFGDLAMPGDVKEI